MRYYQCKKCGTIHSSNVLNAHIPKDAPLLSGLKCMHCGSIQLKEIPKSESSSTDDDRFFILKFGTECVSEDRRGNRCPNCGFDFSDIYDYDDHNSYFVKDGITYIIKKTWKKIQNGSYIRDEPFFELLKKEFGISKIYPIIARTKCKWVELHICPICNTEKEIDMDCE